MMAVFCHFTRPFLSCGFSIKYIHSFIHSFIQIVKRRTAVASCSIGADCTRATGNFAPVLTHEPGQTLRFAPVPFMAVL